MFRYTGTTMIVTMMFASHLLVSSKTTIITTTTATRVSSKTSSMFFVQAFNPSVTKTFPSNNVLQQSRKSTSSNKYHHNVLTTSSSYRPVPFTSSSSTMILRSTSTDGTATTTTASTTTNDDKSIYWTTEKVRSTFIDYFVKQHTHTYQPSSKCAPLNDPTLLFTNSGMNQFKPIFLGQIDPNSPMALLKRATNSQKCIRAGGKHNDLDDVGKDTYHHTFFEMLGSWSFNDYFKKEAIDYAWELLTKEYQLNPERLYATYFEGDSMNDIPPDDEAKNYWLQYLPADHVIACSARDNFWEMGDTGPCGPCTEIHYDRIGNRNAAEYVNADDPNVIEIWNIVFIQYNREVTSKLTTLPAQHIDTGMGLERLVSILQDKTSNYDIDCFQPIFTHLATLTSKGPYTGLVGPENDLDLKDTAYRVIGDHIRTLCFAIADGAVPNNEGRGYVLRRILRRAIRYGQQILGCQPGFFVTLVPVVVDTFGPSYPELISAQSTITEIIQEEEVAFSSMLERGIKYFTDLQVTLQLNERNTVSGQEAFYLYDTLGFPIDLTELMALEAGLQIDIHEFEVEMQQQKERSRMATKLARSGYSGDGTTAVPLMELQAEQTATLNDQMKLVPTNDSFKYEWDVPEGVPAKVLAIYSSDEVFLSPETKVQVGEYVGLILDQSSFYAEGGGQVNDIGTIEIQNGSDGVSSTFVVTDVQVYAGYVLHKGYILSNDEATTTTSLSVGSAVKCHVDYDRRSLVAPNHSMTHVLNAALRQILGTKVEQRGSLCNADKLRFDFSHKSSLSLSELQQVESICQQVVANKQPVTSQYLPLKVAQELEGVQAVFGEVYPDPVRVITIGDHNNNNKENTNISIEFCGGTHIRNTGDAQAFVIVEETAVAKGIRRITAVTNDIATQAIQTGMELTNKVMETELLPPDDIDLEKRATNLRKELDSTEYISATSKIQLRSRIEQLQKKASDAQKKIIQQRIDLCLNDVKMMVEKNTETTTPTTLPTTTIVMQLNYIGTDETKAASQSIMNYLKKMAPNVAFLGLTSDDDTSSLETKEEDDDGTKKIAAFAYVPDTVLDKTSIKANEWIQITLQSCNGKGGGRTNNAQGTSNECKDIDVVLKDAKQYVEERNK